MMIHTVPRQHRAVELLLTGDQHKPCASFNQQACKNTTSVEEGKRKTRQKIASKCAKILKQAAPFWGPKIDPFWGPPQGSYSFFNMSVKNKPLKRVNFWTPKTGPLVSIFLRILTQFFAVFSACLLLRMLYSYMPVD